MVRASGAERAPVELGDHQRVALLQRGQSLIGPRPGAVRAGQSVVGVYTVSRHLDPHFECRAKLAQIVALDLHKTGAKLACPKTPWNGPVGS